jgi:hypothetical protein
VAFSRAKGGVEQTRKADEAVLGEVQRKGDMTIVETC